MFALGEYYILQGIEIYWLGLRRKLGLGEPGDSIIQRTVEGKEAGCSVWEMVIADEQLILHYTMLLPTSCLPVVFPIELGQTCSRQRKDGSCQSRQLCGRMLCWLESFDKWELQLRKKPP